MIFEYKKEIAKIIRLILAIGLYGFGFWICDGEWWRELILVILIIVGTHIQKDIF